ncbi:MAG: AEC family transporter [Desulfobacter sp.]|nr:MAG: AEC family transporter [Desulfobacter sp.]
MLASLDLLGQATVLIAVFVLGATIGSISFKQLPSISDILRVSLVKFVLVPGSVFTLVYLLNFNISLPLVCTMLMIQASSPPATNLILIVKRYGGDTQTISAMMLIQYLIAIFAMPVWIAVWQNFN